MTLLFKLAWRNLFRHRNKSLVIGTIICLGAIIMTIGNALVSGMDHGLSENIRKKHTGDLVIVSDKQDSDLVFFPPMGKPIAMIGDIEMITKFLTHHPDVLAYLPVARGLVMVLSGEQDPHYQMIMATNLSDYVRIFDAPITLKEGVWPTEKMRGILLTPKNQQELLDFTGIHYAPTTDITYQGFPQRNQILLMGIAEDSSTDIAADVLGIIDYKAFQTLFGYYALIDLTSFQNVMGFFTATDTAIPVSTEHNTLLSMDNPDMFFGESPPTDTPSLPTEIIKTKTSPYNQILVKLKPGLSPEATATTLTASLKAAKLPARAIPWKTALGQIGDIATIMRAILNGFVFFMFFIAIIVMMNTLSIATIERSAEIGMMRAIGATKRWLSFLFITETVVLTFFFGMLGIGLGGLGVWIIQLLKIQTQNPIVELLFGGQILSPHISYVDFFWGLFQLGIVSLGSVLYPVILARRISPLETLNS